MSTDTKREVRRRRDQPIILVHIDADMPGAARLYECAGKLNWQLLDLRFRHGPLPAGCDIKGAIINQIPTDQAVRSIMRIGCPVVRLGTFTHPQDAKVPAVIEDLEVEGRLAAEHFAERGFRHVGYVGRTPWRHFRSLYESFATHTKRLGGTSHLLRLRVHYDIPFRSHYAIYQKRFSDWMRTLPMPLGLLAYSDHWAVELTNMSTESGYDVPHQIAILGRGNAPFIVNCCLPKLSSIVIDYDRRAEVAVDTLQRLMQGKPLADTTIRVPPKGIVTRESTDILAVSDPLVSRALRFLWTHYDLDISVDDVAREVGLPRYKLERLFRQHLQRGVNEKLVRKRLQVFVDLLRITDEPIGKLAARCGFRTIANLNRSFLCLYGMSPRQYRNAKHPPP